jgi:bifunctional non-homologous end joining protein LigD
MLPRVRPRPAGIDLCQPMTTANPPAGPGWLHEIKYDGFRMLARRDDERVRLFTRNANDGTDRYPLVAEAIGALKVRSLTIDGEIAVCDGKGLAVFDLLRHGPRIKHDAILFAFDLLERDLQRRYVLNRAMRS